MRPRAALAALLVVVTIVSAGCAARGGPASLDSDLVRLTFLQINDHYVLGPVDGGRRGGMARLATLVKEIKRENPNTVFAIGGDFLSPSVESTFLQGSRWSPRSTPRAWTSRPSVTTSSTSGRRCCSSA